MTEGCDMMRRLALDAGFQHAECMPTKGHPGVFATLDAGARRTFGLYFMYDVKQVNPEEWSSPPWEARLVDMPDLGKVVMGRGAVNQKGPQAAFLAALHAIRGAGRKLPVNLVLVAEGEEEIGSPNFPQVVLAPEVRAALSKCVGIFMPEAAQELDGNVHRSRSAPRATSSASWSRAARSGDAARRSDVHSSLARGSISPAWHLVQALNTLVDADGRSGDRRLLRERASAERRPSTKMLDDAAKQLDEKQLQGIARHEDVGAQCELAPGARGLACRGRR